MNKETIKIIGGGLAGCECAYQLLKRGFNVKLYEMRPVTKTPIHKTDSLAELVCSNSLKSNDVDTSQGLLKAELRMLDSLLLKCAEKCSVPAGGALAVNREDFSRLVEDELNKFDNLEIIREEVEDIDLDEYTVIAAGPLCSEKLTKKIMELTSETELNFYDAVAPIISFKSIDMNKAFFCGRYGKGGDDYLNCPMEKDEFLKFANELVNAETVILKDFENKDIFNACMPIEVMAKKGIDSMRFGPLRPVGIINPTNNKKYYAVVQLRKEDNYNNLYNIVGFQTNLKFKEQERVFRLIPGLENAEFVRYGVMHKNIFINAPQCINANFRSLKYKKLYFAGQISGVEGYMESTMSGLMCAINIYRQIIGFESIIPSEETAIGSLVRYISSPKKNFQPMHVSYELMPELEEKTRDKKLRKHLYSERAIIKMQEFVNIINNTSSNS